MQHQSDTSRPTCCAFSCRTHYFYHDHADALSNPNVRHEYRQVTRKYASIPISERIKRNVIAYHLTSAASFVLCYDLQANIFPQLDFHCVTDMRRTTSWCMALHRTVRRAGLMVDSCRVARKLQLIGRIWKISKLCHCLVRNTRSVSRMLPMAN